MNKRDKAAFVIYFLGFLTILGFGVAYVFCSTIMPYHHEAIKMNWEDLGPGLQTLLQGLIKTAASSMFVTGVMGMVLLFIPFRRGESWARWAVPLCGLLWNVPALYVTSTIALQTGASTPWPFSLVGLISTTVAFALAPPHHKAAGHIRAGAAC